MADATDADIDRAVEALRRAGHDVPPRSTIGRILDSRKDAQHGDS